MTKAQLEAQIARMEDDMKELRRQLDVERKARNEEISIMKVSHNNAIRDIQDKVYLAWREVNGEFVKRYICDLLRTNTISFEFDSPFGGYVDMKVRVDEEVQQSTEFQVCMDRNYE